MFELELLRTLPAFVRRNEGQTMAEYAVVLAVITIAVIVTLGTLSTKIKGQLTSVVNVL